MARVSMDEIGDALDEFNKLEQELHSDELDREHRELDIYEGIDIGRDLEHDDPEDWFYDEPHYDWQDDYFDPYPMCDDYHDEDFI